MHPRFVIPLAASALAVLALALTLPEAPAADTPCTDRVFLSDGGSFSWGSVTRWRRGHLTAFHVIDSGTVASGPQVISTGALEATDFAFLTGSDATADPASVPALEGAVTLEGFPARSFTRETVKGRVYAPDTVPPGVWVILDHPEPLVGGFSGGCVRDAQGRVVAVIMGASTMILDGTPRHFARVIPLRAALAEIQGTPPTAAPLSLFRLPLPPVARWPQTAPDAP